MKLLGPRDDCEFYDDDGAYRSYQCIPGYKCTKQDGMQSKACVLRHSLEDGENSNEYELCRGGHSRNGKCASVQEVKGVGSGTLRFPHKCDLDRFTTCEARLSDGGWVDFGAC
jgi:hypothetical protein